VVAVDDIDEGDKIRRIRRNLERPQAALEQVGALMVSESQQAFRDQKIGDKQWEQRGKVNIFGILADFHAGKKEPPPRRFQRRPVLVDTGRLKASVTWKVVGSGDTVEVGSVLPYAPVHHHGGEIESAPITEQVRTLLAAYLKGKGKDRRKQLGWLLNEKLAGTRLKGKVPARPIVAVTKQTIEDVREAVGVKIFEAE